MCVSHATTIRMLDKLGQNFDSDVLDWKKEIESRIDIYPQVYYVATNPCNHTSS